MSEKSEFPVPTHTTISTYHLDRLVKIAEEMKRERDEARMWAARFYQGWETNDSILPSWIKDKEVPHGVSH